MNENCKNCGGDEGLHHYETMQCPFGGVEAPLGKERVVWIATHFEPESDIEDRVATLEQKLERLQSEFDHLSNAISRAE